MWLPDRSTLKGTSEATRFLVLRWRELFAKHTPDTYRPRLMDTPGLLEELRWVSQMAEKDDRWNRQRRLVVEELTRVADSDQLVPELSPRIHYALSDLSDETLPGECEAVARLGCEALQDYGDLAFDKLEQLLDQEGEDERFRPKRQADTLLGLIATRAVQRGFGRRYCEQLFDEEDLAESPLTVVEKLRTGLNGSEREWRCVYALNSARRNHNIIEKLLKKSEFNILEGEDSPSGGQEWTQFIKQTESSHYAHIEITATDPQEAVHQGLVQLNRLVDLVNFYHSAAPVRIERKIYADHQRELGLLSESTRAGEEDGEPKNQELVESIFPATAYHPLVCNRLFRLWEEFSDPSTLIKVLEVSLQRMKWQLERIYRARNLLVHTGRRPEYLPYLLKNLEYYFSTVLGRVLHDLNENPKWTVMDALQSRRLEWVFLRDALKKKPGIITAADLNLELPSGVSKRPVWGKQAH